jgi:hypothetical protein
MRINLILGKQLMISPPFGMGKIKDLKNSILDYYFFIKNRFARRLIGILALVLTILTDVFLHYERSNARFLEGLDPISIFLIQGFICISIGFLFGLFLLFIFNYFARRCKR